MYRLLIVDDEYLVIEGLKKLVDWKRHGMTLAAEASSGREGVRLAAEHKPDIVITDINMPDLSGLDMMKLMLDSNPRIKFIVLSGYDDFHWAKRAFGYGAVDYLLKPVDLAQLNAVLEKAAQKIREEDSAGKQREELARAMSRSLAALKKDVLSELMTGRYSSEETLAEKLKLAGIVFGDSPCAAFVAREKSAPDTPAHRRQERKEFLLGVLHALEDEGWGYGYLSDEGALVFLVCVPGTSSRWCAVLGRDVARRFAFEDNGVVLGIGREYGRSARIKFSYIEAERAVAHQYLVSSPVVHYEDIQRQLMLLEKVGYPPQFVDSVLEGLKASDREIVVRALDAYHAGLSGKKIELTHFKSVMTEFLFAVRNGLKGMNVDLSKAFIDEFADIYSMNEKQSIEEVWAVVRQYLACVTDYIDSMSSRGGRQVIKEVMRIIDESYTDSSLTLSDVAGRVFLTPNYVSMLVKKETGQSFSDILLRKRVEKAKELLFDETLKTYEIADRVGYTDNNYFFKVFKKVVGMSPGDFRNKFCQ